MKRILLVFLVAALSFSLSGCGGGEPPADTPPDTTTPPEQRTSPNDTNSGATFDPDEVYSPGEYEVGVDIPAGEFRVTGFDYERPYAAVYSDPAHSSVELTLDIPRYFYVTVEDGQSLEVVDASFMLSSARGKLLESTIYEGMHLVGADCKPGTYQLLNVGGGDGYYCVYDSSAVNKKELASGNIGAEASLEVSEGQYLVLIGITGHLQ